MAQQPAGSPRREKVAILGGGMGALATAWFLSRTPELRGRYEVTVYQLGWRLGGKLASGRDVANHYRNVEHGLHVWFGFYDNAFRLYQELFSQWEKPEGCPWQRWEDAFLAQNLTPFGEEDRDGRYSYWPVTWPTNPAVPGQGGVLLTPWEYIVELVRFLSDLFDRTRDVALQAPMAPPPGNVLERFTEALQWHPVPEARQRGFDFTPSGLVHRVLTWLESFGDDHARLCDSPTHLEGMLWLLDQLHCCAREGEQRCVDEKLKDLQRLYKVLDIGIAFVKGLLNPKYGILRDLDLDRINHLEFREWLVENGANPEVVYNWTVLRGVYDAMFQYIDGDRRRPSYEAGTAARVVIRIGFTYKGSVMYLIDAGMGETVIGPMYDALLKNGVKFEFFRKVRRVELSADKKRIARVHFDRQVDLVDRVYRPTFKYKGLTCWPSEPDWEQLVDGQAMKEARVNLESHWNAWPAAGQEVVEDGKDFDRVVLGIALPGFKRLNAEEPSICQELIDALPAFREMTEAFPMVPSVGLQLWMDRDLPGLGWGLGKPAMDAWATPHNVWTDMTQVLAHEGWEGTEKPPRSLQYLCGVFDSQLYREPASRTDTQARGHEQARRETIAQLERYAGSIWPEATRGGEGFDWNVLYDPSGAVGPARLEAQYLRANVDPNDCVECSAKDTSRFRMGPTDAGVDNLVLTGGWVRTGVNSTCVEAAVMSGMAAARAISGEPLFIVGEHFMARRPEAPLAPRPAPRWPSFFDWPSKQVRPREHELPDYQPTRGYGEQEMLPPGLIEGARASVFALRADADAITRFANGFLGGPTGGAITYSALAPLVLVLFQDAARMTSLAEPVGYLPDKEAAFAVLLWEWDKRGLNLPRPVLWMPYIVIDNSIGLVTGMNVWGYRKEVGSVSVPMPGAPEPYRADTWLFRTLTRESRGEFTTLFEVRGPSTPVAEETRWTEPAGFGAWLMERVRLEMGAVGGRVEQGMEQLKSLVLRDHFQLRLPVTNLKQFRDATYPRKACYQALIRNEMVLTRFKLGGVLGGEYRMNVTPCQSHQIVQSLGLPSYRDIPVAFGAWVEMDYQVMAGSETWRARGT